jgi:dolichyl-diphosphooligosaccharide--protein glycosyltransferase
MGPKQAQAFVESLKNEEKDWPEDLPPQYFVVSWENLRLAYWISFYGNWDLVSGSSSGGKIQRVTGQVQFNTQKGMLKLKNREIPLDGVSLLNKKGTHRFSWSNGSNIYAVMNNLSRELYLMDGTIYHSMLVQMLIGDPDAFKEHFELVVDRYPWNRAYRVR